MHFSLFFFGLPMPYAVLLQSGIDPVPPALEAWSLNHWTTREVSNMCILMFVNYTQTLQKLKKNEKTNPLGDAFQGIRE